MSRDPNFGNEQNIYNYNAPQNTGQSSFNPTNPSPYNYQWGQQNINNYLSSPFTNPHSQNPLSFLESQGINIEGLDESSLAFLPNTSRLTTAFDRMNTQVGMARTGLGFDMDAQQLAGRQNLLGMTGGQGLSSIGTGFGAQGRNTASNLGSINQGYQTGLNQSMAGFQSDILGMQYDYQDAQTDYQDALTSALGNIMASGEDKFTVSLADGYNTYGTTSGPSFSSSMGGASSWGTGQDWGGS